MMCENDEVRGWLRQVNPGDTDEGFSFIQHPQKQKSYSVFFYNFSFSNPIVIVSAYQIIKPVL